MFDITADEITLLNDGDLRELIGRLCEAELASYGLSPSAVTWGGHQTAPDGGLDVFVDLPVSTSIDGFIPRPITGFQVKKPDMPKSKILDEMRPTDSLRPVISELIEAAGAYVIVSSTGSTADKPLRDRRKAMREALGDPEDTHQIHTDFYDRTRIATWVRRHPGLITWVKERVGKAVVGWRPYGPWSGVSEGVDAEYLLDEKLRLHFGNRHDESPSSLVEAIDELRDRLAQPGNIVRLVGLSGVGKTRLAQALFDARVGTRPLTQSHAVYTNLSDDPDPQPAGLASDLMASRMRAVLIIDNCPPELHGRLSELCGGETSTVSVLTIEYDVRGDQPEGTQVVTLDTSSLELIEKLVQRRFPHISSVDRDTIAEVSGGNARIATALAETVGSTETIAGLSNEALFQRLFRQRHGQNDELLQAAQVFSLVYSFNGEALDGAEAELPRLAELANQSVTQTYGHLGELLRRDLVQKRGDWRAVLPHAVANRLAARALEDIPFDFINRQFIGEGTDRLARSFSRRLSFLHDHPKAIAIAERWLAADGLLGDVSKFNELGQAMFENVAPILPDAALAALERVNIVPAAASASTLRRNLSVLRSIAYDPHLFKRSALRLAYMGTQSAKEYEARNASDIFTSLFTIVLSGTHATIDQRLEVIERLLRTDVDKCRILGLAGFDAVLKTSGFSSGYHFGFGARSRDFGYRPLGNDDAAKWYTTAIKFIERLALNEGLLKPQLRTVLAQNFRGLWSSALVCDELEALVRKFAADGFWREGWTACRQTIRFDKSDHSSDAYLRLQVLEVDLRPKNLTDSVRAIVLGTRVGGLDLEFLSVDENPMTETERLDEAARGLGEAIACDENAFAELLPEILCGGCRAFMFGRGLASASLNVRNTWNQIVVELDQIVAEQRDVQVLRGILAELWSENSPLAHELLDSAAHQPNLRKFIPWLHSATVIDERSSERLKQALLSEGAPIEQYGRLAYGPALNNVAPGKLNELLLLIADQPNGFDVALEILYMRLLSGRRTENNHSPELVETGRELLRRVTFSNDKHREGHQLAEIIGTCLLGQDSAPIAHDIASRLRQSILAYETYAFDNTETLKALLKTHPGAVLDALFACDDKPRKGINTFEHLEAASGNPADVISSEALIAWCEKDRETRFSLAASIITFATRTETDAPLDWSGQATALLANAPSPKDILAVFVERFTPTSGSGSLAAIMEANARLLDRLELPISPELAQFVNQAKAQLATSIDHERERERSRDRALDERFE